MYMKTWQFKVLIYMKHRNEEATHNKKYRIKLTLGGSEQLHIGGLEMFLFSLRFCVFKNSPPMLEIYILFQNKIQIIIHKEIFTIDKYKNFTFFQEMFDMKLKLL